MDISYMQFLLYVLGAVLLGALILLVIRLIYSVKRINSILDSVDSKMKTVDKAFGAVDRIVDSLSLAADRVVDGVASGINKVFSNKKKKKDIKDDKEEK